MPISANPRPPERKQKMHAEAAARTVIGFMLPDERRLDECTTVERGNSRPTDPFVGRHQRLQAHAKAAST